MVFIEHIDLLLCLFSSLVHVLTRKQRKNNLINFWIDLLQNIELTSAWTPAQSKPCLWAYKPFNGSKWKILSGILAVGGFPS